MCCSCAAIIMFKCWERGSISYPYIEWNILTKTLLMIRIIILWFPNCSNLPYVWQQKYLSGSICKPNFYWQTLTLIRGHFSMLEWEWWQLAGYYQDNTVISEINKEDRNMIDCVCSSFWFPWKWLDCCRYQASNNKLAGDHKLPFYLFLILVRYCQLQDQI